jgi:hypothetical protein
MQPRPRALRSRQRVHLKAVFRKTNTHRQPELIVLLLDALPSVLRQGREEHLRR